MKRQRTTKTIPTAILIALAVFTGFSAKPADSPSAAASLPQPTAKANESESLAKLREEKAALEKRLQEINMEISRIWTGQGVTFLGMTLVDPTEQAMEHWGLRKESPLPIIVEVHDPSYFPEGMRPGAGCAFWIVEPPANGFLFNQKQSVSYRPKTVRDLIEAIVACTATPDEYLKLYKRTTQAARERADALEDKPEEQQRLLKIADAKMPAEEAGKYVCRVVYNYRGNSGTMTTSIRMTKKDLDQLRELLGK